MNNNLEYKGYLGSVEYSKEDDCLYGKVIGIKGLISYEGDSLTQLKEDFQNAVDDYLEMCEKKKIQPEKAFKGSLLKWFCKKRWQISKLFCPSFMKYNT